MKKKIILFIFILTLTFSLTSCGLLNIFKNRDKLAYSFSEEEGVELIQKMEAFPDRVPTLSSTEFKTEWAMINLDIYEVATCVSLSSIKYSMYGEEETMNDYLRFTELFNEILDLQNKIMVAVYNSPHKDEFFKDYTEEEILAMINDNYPSQYYELSNTATELTTQYTALDPESADWATKADEIYVELVSIYNQMSKLLGYNNYLEHAYKDIYARDYTTSDAKLFSYYVSNYISDEGLLLYNDAIDDFTSMATFAQAKIQAFNSGLYNDYKFYFDKYAKHIGGSYLETYEYAWSDYSYVFFGNENSQPGAYTTYIYNQLEPAMYFGPGYQNILTVVHETGHYYAATELQGLDIPLDLAEVHSQANELLFLDYIEQYYLTDFSESNMNMIHRTNFSEMLINIIISTIVNDFEMLVYQESNLTVGKLDYLLNQACIPFGGLEYINTAIGTDLREYCRLVTIEHPGYYISYAMSLIPALELYSAGKEDLSLAIDKYLDLCTSEEDFLVSLEAAGLTSPFEEKVYIDICNIY
ncbi:MAG: hypothetical protein IJY14_03410 [Acholeplasmatales bacterium]|nr:hypothetical protein [Acholeplasmatales bacterium]